MSQNLGPPGPRDADGRSTPEPATTEESDNSTTNAIQSSRPTRQCSCNTPPRGRYHGPYDPWRAAFRRGAIDALRLAARRIDDPHTWMVLSELRECYETERWPAA
jgi:hypothetical protein